MDNQEIRIITEQCDGCGACAESCPYGAIKLEGGKAGIDYAECTGCGACVAACPKSAIIQGWRAEKSTGDLTVYKGLLVTAEVTLDQGLAPVSLELLGAARKLGQELNETVTALLMGEAVADLAPELISHGAETVYLAEHPLLKDYRAETYAKAVVQAVREVKPGIVLFGATLQGRDLAPRAAKRLQTGLTADCTGLEIDPETRLLFQTRPAFGGNIMATIKCPSHRPQMVTARPGVFLRPQPDPGLKGAVVPLKPELSPDDVLLKVIEKVRGTKTKVNLETAEVIVSAGRGVANPEGLALVQALAEALGGSLGASRGAVEAGLVSEEHQVGQTGKHVRPRLYIACGIHGAVQHLTGMRDSDCVIAINKDPEAPIFQAAHLGVAGDLRQVIPILLQEIEKIKRSGGI